jgi:hypothetical protein
MISCPSIEPAVNSAERTSFPVSVWVGQPAQWRSRPSDAHHDFHQHFASVPPLLSVPVTMGERDAQPGYP